MLNDKCYLIMGGGGMIGYQIAQHICEDKDFVPNKIIIASLYQSEVQESVRKLKRHAPGVTFVPVWGNLFVREEYAGKDKARLTESHDYRRGLIEDLFGNMEHAIANSKLAKLILEHNPDVIVDTINTATVLSYQDVTALSRKLDKLSGKIQSEVGGHIHNIKNLLQSLETNGNDSAPLPVEEMIATLKELQGFLSLFKTTEGVDRTPSLQEIIGTLIVSQAVPQLVRHTLILYEAMKRARTRLYIKVGTTGTGGMGLNIPYTHSEAKPSAQLMSKTAVAFAQTGLLFLMARTPDAPLVKEIKPAAMVGYQKISLKTIKKRDGSPRFVYSSQQQMVGDTLDLRMPERAFDKINKLKMVGVDTGENGFFALGEFEAITNMKQMEFTTPEEISEQVVLEIKGRNTGLEVISALDASVMNPSYRAGFLRHLVVQHVRELDNKEGNSLSVALRDLGPPELSKLLYEAHLLALEYNTLAEVLNHGAADIAAAAEKRLNDNAALRDQITSIGIPILLPDGKTFWRGPFIAYPEIPSEHQVIVDPASFELWVSKGWVDLRAENFELWLERIKTITRRRKEQLSRDDSGSATYNQKFYAFDEIRIGEVVGWIFNNEIAGHRIIGG